MFEQSTVPSGPVSKRLWATCIGVTGEALLVIGAILAPMVFPQVLPRTSLVTSLLPPVPPGTRKADPERPKTTHAQARKDPYRIAALVIPTRIPLHAAMIVDPPPDTLSTGPGVPGLDAGGPNSGTGALMAGILGGVGAAPPPRPRVEPARTAEPAAPPSVPRVKIGGLVKPAALLSRVDPVYPSLARQMRVAGTVELQGVIGTDGRIRELRVLNGHPLLTRAALDAVSQWVYAPTRLNDQLVEVITTITLTFHLN